MKHETTYEPQKSHLFASWQKARSLFNKRLSWVGHPMTVPTQLNLPGTLWVRLLGHRSSVDPFLIDAVRCVLHSLSSTEVIGNDRWASFFPHDQSESKRGGSKKKVTFWTLLDAVQLMSVDRTRMPPLFPIKPLLMANKKEPVPVETRRPPPQQQEQQQGHGRHSQYRRRHRRCSMIAAILFSQCLFHSLVSFRSQPPHIHTSIVTTGTTVDLNRQREEEEEHKRLVEDTYGEDHPNRLVQRQEGSVDTSSTQKPKNSSTDDKKDHNHATLVGVIQDEKQSTPKLEPAIANKRFHEFPIAEFHQSKLKGRKLYTSAFEEATVLNASSSSWFVPQKHCLPLQDRSNASCCAETVAISLDQDDHHIINTADSLDIADLSLEKYGDRNGLRFFSTQGKQQLGLDTSVFPCLQPGTIFHIDNHGNLLDEFFIQLLPNITVPFVILTTKSDADSPFRFGERLGTEPKLLKWYGQSPLLTNIPKNEHYDLAVSKLESFPLGLTVRFEQSRLLNRYLELRNYTNPFSGVQLERWTNASVWKVLDNPNATSGAIDNAFYDTLFVKFGVNGNSQPWRRPLWDYLCDTVSANPRRDSISCNSSQTSTLEIYRAGSPYLFGMSPMGMGWDCYRTYELLILGIIPIVPARPGGTHRQFENLPVLEFNMSAIPNMSKRQLLQEMRDYIQSDAFVKADFAKGWERLFLRYRRRHVLKTTGRDKDIVVDPHTGREFYQAWRYSVVQGSFASSDK